LILLFVSLSRISALDLSSVLDLFRPGFRTDPGRAAEYGYDHQTGRELYVVSLLPYCAISLIAAQSCDLAVCVDSKLSEMTNLTLVLQPLTAGTVLTARRGQDVMQAFKPTTGWSVIEWTKNFAARHVSRFCDGCTVAQGFYLHYTGIMPLAERRIAKLGQPTLLVGFSLGAATALLHLAMSLQLGRPPATFYSYGSPRVGNAQFAKYLQGATIYNVVHNKDIVTTLPPRIMGYRRPGHEAWYEASGQDFRFTPDYFFSDDQLEYTSLQGSFFESNIGDHMSYFFGDQNAMNKFGYPCGMVNPDSIELNASTSLPREILFLSMEM